MPTEKRLLSVDDDPAVLALIGKVALDLGFSVEAVTNSSSFMPTYLQQKPDVITLDIFMPGTDGVELIRWLAEIGSQARIIIVSGSDIRYSLMAKQLGSWNGALQISSLRKPFTITDLRAALTGSIPPGDALSLD